MKGTPKPDGAAVMLALACVVVALRAISGIDPIAESFALGSGVSWAHVGAFTADVWLLTVFVIALLLAIPIEHSAQYVFTTVLETIPEHAGLLRGRLQLLALLCGAISVPAATAIILGHHAAEWQMVRAALPEGHYFENE